MKASAKAMRIQRHYKRGKSTAALNLVSLMDIFTILVFFLMVNSSSDVQILNQDNAIKLPTSSADQPPQDILSLTVTHQDVLVNGRKVINREALLRFQGDVEPTLKAELDYVAQRASAPAPEAGRPITILADQQVPYELLRKIMATCVDAGYAAISLAVNHQTERGA